MQAVPKTVRVFVALLAFAALTSCSNDPSEEAQTDHDIDTYARVIREVVGTAPFDDVDDRRDVVIWVYGLDDHTIPLEVQVGVLEDLEDFATVRFVDAFDEAVLEEQPGRPVIDDGVVIGVGEITGSRVAVERYDGGAIERRQVQTGNRGGKS